MPQRGDGGRYPRCPACHRPTLKPEHAHDKCLSCGYMTHCCEGADWCPPGTLRSNDTRDDDDDDS